MYLRIAGLTCVGIFLATVMTLCAFHSSRATDSKRPAGFFWSTRVAPVCSRQSSPQAFSCRCWLSHFPESSSVIGRKQTASSEVSCLQVNILQNGSGRNVCIPALLFSHVCAPSPFLPTHCISFLLVTKSKTFHKADPRARATVRRWRVPHGSRGGDGRSRRERARGGGQ